MSYFDEKLAQCYSKFKVGDVFTPPVNVTSSYPAGEYTILPGEYKGDGRGVYCMTQRKDGKKDYVWLVHGEVWATMIRHHKTAAQLEAIELKGIYRERLKAKDDEISKLRLKTTNLETK